MYRPDWIGLDHSVQTQIKLDQDVQTRLDQTRPKCSDQNQDGQTISEQTGPKNSDLYRPDQSVLTEI